MASIEFPPPPARICKGCHKKQPIAVFARSSRSPDGRGHICRTCRKARELRYEGFDPRDITDMIGRALRKTS